MPRPISYAVFCLKKKKLEPWLPTTTGWHGSVLVDCFYRAHVSFFSNDATTPTISTLSLHDALPILQLDNQKEIAEMQNETQKEIAGIQSATSRQNTKDQVYAQNEMLAYQQKESTARVASIMENTNLSKQQQVSEIM